MAIAGIDIGTTGCKCSIYSNDGNFQGEAYREYEITKDSKHRTIDPVIVWSKIQEVIKEASRYAPLIQAIGVTSFGESGVLLDDQDQPLMASLLYIDPRGSLECQSITEDIGTSYVNNTTGLNPDSMYTLPKLMWIKDNEPEIYKKTKRICLFEDYIVYMLCGVAQIDYSLATRTMAFNINTLQWDQKLLDYAGIDVSLLSTPVPTGSIAGPLIPSLAAELGLSEETLVVSGCHDQIGAAIGTGVLQNGMAVDGTGTVECITNVFDDSKKNIDRSKLYEGNYAVVPFLKGLNITYAVTFTAGALLKWYRDQIGTYEAQLHKSNDQSDYDFFNSQLPNQDPSGLLVLPYFAGSGTPYMDSEIKGAIIGMDLTTTSSDIYKGLMEGITYEMRLNLERMKDAGIVIDTICATGGGANSQTWLQIKADIFNKPISTLDASQSGTLGCIMLAGVASGIYESLDQAKDVFVTYGKTYYPNPQRAHIYDGLYTKYKNLYPALKKL